MSARRAKRLDPGVRPSDVDLAIRVDPEHDDVFSGRVRIEIQLDRARQVIEMHAAEIQTSRARLTIGDKVLKGRIERDPERETIRIRWPQRVGPGPATLEVQFRGRLRPDLKGFYRARSGRHRYALTQLAATHARRMFPCFDEPAMKARFRLSVTTRRALTVLANQPCERIEPADRGFVTHRFSRTPPLASYLVALAVGRFEASRTVRVGQTPVRVWHVPGKGHLTAFALQAARASLARLEHWFALPHPYEKLDLIAVPDFEFGAMENAGAVFFRETALLLDPETASANERRRVAEVIAHELAHMWFGNLVTMAWWDDLWLNESFATWMAFHIIHDWKPEWGMWREFQDGTAAALRVDSLSDTHPVYCEVLDVATATENFDEITYEKGAAIVRMIERTLGASFRRGVRQYIRDHREGNTVAADLWRALSHASGQDVAALAGAWIELAGHPVVELHRTRDGDRIGLSQRPFQVSQRAGAVAPDSRWPIPWSGRVLGGRRPDRQISGSLYQKRARIKIPPSLRGRPIYANADQCGFFRALHSPEELAEIGSRADSLSAIERMGLVDDAWALSQAGLLPLSAYLDLIPDLARDADPAVLGTLSTGIHGLGHDVGPSLPSEAAEQWRAFIRDGFGPLRGQPFHVSRSNDDGRDARAHRIAILGGVAEDENVLAAAAVAARAYCRDPGSLAPAFADVAVGLAAQTGDEALFDRFERLRRSARTPQLARRALMAETRFRDPLLFGRALAHCLDPTLPSGDVAILLVRGFANPAGAEATWQFTKKNWKALQRRMGAMLVTRVIDATPALGTRDARRDVAQFFRRHPIPTGERALRQALERFDLAIAFRRRAATEMANWLTARQA